MKNRVEKENIQGNKGLKKRKRESSSDEDCFNIFSIQPVMRERKKRKFSDSSSSDDSFIIFTSDYSSEEETEINSQIELVNYIANLFRENPNEFFCSKKIKAMIKNDKKISICVDTFRYGSTLSAMYSNKFGPDYENVNLGRKKGNFPDCVCSSHFFHYFLKKKKKKKRKKKKEELVRLTPLKKENIVPKRGKIIKQENSEKIDENTEGDIMEMKKNLQLLKEKREEFFKNKEDLRNLREREELAKKKLESIRKEKGILDQRVKSREKFLLDCSEMISTIQVEDEEKKNNIDQKKMEIPEDLVLF